MNRFIERMAFIGLTFTLGFLPGCEDHDDEHDPHQGEQHAEGAVEEACEHMADGPFEDVSATATAGDAPSATHEHTAVNISLVADASSPADNIGYVTFAADEATEFAFYLSTDIPFAVFDAMDTEVLIEESTAVVDCSEVAVEHVADLEVGTYTLWFGPTIETMVSLVVEEAGYEEHDGEH